jgi:hypothetical protein
MMKQYGSSYNFYTKTIDDIVIDNEWMNELVYI